MPNKDSFTFSDKLRKSKSVPLSKRLPSIVGGQNKQKRTLVQRAQRDLPFILVAALALLLLPFLSRNGSDDIPNTGELVWNSMSDAPGFTETGYSDIQPLGSMQDPLDLILRPRSASEESGVTMGADASKSAYGRDGDEESSSYSSRYGKKTTTTSSRPDYNTRNQYDEQYTKKVTKTPATEKYGKKSRAGVRQSIVRKGTEINRALRISQIPGPRSGSGISHSLPFGQGPNRTPGTAFREGVRPIALQPMEARGAVGRGSDGLRAEADRSIREMNAGGPAKANLLAAQMRDVDGKPLGDTHGFGGPGPGASVRPGAGGGPGNTNGYNVQKPWWWSMMETRSQKMWDLLYYKPREMFYTNLYKIGLGIFNCLATGNKDGDISTMFGKKAGTPEVTCVGNSNWTLSWPDFLEQAKLTNKTSDGKATEESTAASFKDWQEQCEKGGGYVSSEKGSRKTALQVRMECLGLDYKRMKGWFKAKSYGANCSHVNNDPLEFTYSVTKNGKTKQRLENKAVVALVAKLSTDTVKGGEQHHWKEGDKDNYYQLNGQEFVVYAQVGTKLSMSSADLNNIRKSDICTLTKVIGFVPRADRGVVEKHVDRANVTKLYDDKDKENFLKEYEKQNVPVIDSNGKKIDSYTDKENKAQTKQEGININNLAHFRAQVQAAQRICTGKTSYSDVHPLTLNGVYDLADFVSQDGLFNSGVKKNSYQECTIWDKKPTFAKEINNEKCESCCEKGIEILENVEFKATITNSKDKHVYAVLIDQIDQQSKAKISYMVDFNASGSEGKITGCETGNDCTYQFNVDSAVLGLNFENFGKSVMATNDVSKGLARGSGVVFWIVTQGDAKFKKHKGDDVADDIHVVNIDDIIESSQSLISELCRYKWCDDKTAGCKLPQRTSPKDYCVEDGEAYLAQKVTLDKKEVMVKMETTPTPMSKEELEKLKKCVMLCHGPDGVHICDKNGIPDEKEPPCPLEDMNPQIPTPQCHGCCTYTTSDGKTNNYKSVEINGKHYIVDARPSDCQNPKYNKCNVAAWSKEGNDLIVYNIGMDPYDPKCLKFVPGESAEPFKTCTGNGCPPGPVKLTAFDPEDSDSFTLIHEQSYCMDPNLDPNPKACPNKNPQFFELFPQLKAPKDIEVDLSPCSFCGPSLYSNADVQAKEETIQEISDDLRECFNRIHYYESLGATESVKQLKTVYFYGYASKRGSHKDHVSGVPGYVGCTTSGYDRSDGDFYKENEPGSASYHWGNCNKALSEDRNLYIMDRLLTELSDFEIGVDADSTTKYKGLRGFSNTLPRKTGVIDDARSRSVNTYRLIKHPNALAGEFTFVSLPCGSDGAAADYDKSLEEQQPDRLVLIAPVAPIGSTDGCGPRMTCGDKNALVEQKLRQIEQDIREELKGKDRTVSKAQNTQPVVSEFITATESDEPLILEEESDSIKGEAKPTWQYDEEEQEETNTFIQNTRTNSTFDGE